MTLKKQALLAAGIALLAVLIGCTEDVTTTIVTVINNDVTPNEALDHGSISTDATPYLTGTVGIALPATATVQVFDGATFLGVATLNAARTGWTYQSTALSPGLHNLQAAAVRADGAQGSKSAAWAITIQSPTPSVKLPHTGVKQCYSANNSVLGSCTSVNVALFDINQDGWLSYMNPQSYSKVGKINGGTYDLTDCVKDNVTGLIWEGKTTQGPRGYNIAVSNLDDVNSPQKGPSLYPIAAEINNANNSIGYVNQVNASALCGFSDWRLPTAKELESLVDLSKAFSTAPTVQKAWFPNTYTARPYWSSTPSATDASQAWNVTFSTGSVGHSDRLNAMAIRLVRVGHASALK